MLTSSLAALALIKAIAALDFRAFERDDFFTFADADSDAQIAFADATFAVAVSDAFGDALFVAEGNTIAVIVSGEHVEIVALDPEGDSRSYSLDLGRLG